MTLMYEQLRQLRNAFFIARALGRALILPHVICTCEMGFWPNHIVESCRATLHHEGFDLVRHDASRLRFHALEETLQGRQFAKLHDIVQILVEHGEPFGGGLLL